MVALHKANLVQEEALEHVGQEPHRAVVGVDGGLGGKNKNVINLFFLRKS